MTGNGLLTELHEASRAGRAIAAINVYDTAQALAVADAAEHEDAPVILQTGSSSLAAIGERPLAASTLAVRDSFGGGRLSVHLDHCRDIDTIGRCLESGYDSVMIDGSHLPLDQNIAQTRTVVHLAHGHGAWVEAELGALAGDEDRSTDPGEGVMTDPADAATFVEATGTDLLAVAVGNVHGLSRAPVNLALDRLAAIQRRVAVPLVLHGASGLPDDDLRAAIELGVCKINVNTEIRRAYLDALKESLSASDGNDDLIMHFNAARSTAFEVVRTKIRLFAGADTHRNEACQ